MTNFVRLIAALPAIALTLLIAGAAGLTFSHLQGQKLLSVQTASMLPTFRPGDALIVEPVQPNQLHIGDIISYHSLRQPTVVISHRLVAIDYRTGWLTTQGDALHSPDPSFPPSLLVGQARAVAPRLGMVLNFLRQPIGLILVIYLPATVILVAEVRRLARAYTDPLHSARL